MPDRRLHRGPHPDDKHLFAVETHRTLRRAVEELSWLLSHDYADNSAIALVGNHHGLTVRQRNAVMRSSCSDAALARRRSTERHERDVAGVALGLDGYNLLITVESALSGGVVLIGRDGGLRDLAGLHGTYRNVTETTPALEHIIDAVASLAPARVDWYLDQPVSNSGRLKAIIAETLERVLPRETSIRWNIEVTRSPDDVLAEYEGVTISSDSAILDRCASWMNLASRVVHNLPSAWIVDLRPEAG